MVLGWSRYLSDVSDFLLAWMEPERRGRGNSTQPVSAGKWILDLRNSEIHKSGRWQSLRVSLTPMSAIKVEWGPALIGKTHWSPSSSSSPDCSHCRLYNMHEVTFSVNGRDTSLICPQPIRGHIGADRILLRGLPWWHASSEGFGEPPLRIVRNTLPTGLQVSSLWWVIKSTFASFSLIPSSRSVLDTFHIYLICAVLWSILLEGRVRAAVNLDFEIPWWAYCHINIHISLICLLTTGNCWSVGCS